MYRILVGAAFHETNTFWPHPTGIKEFEKRDLLFGNDITGKFENTHTPLGAFIEVLKREGVEIILSIAANAEPSGTVTKEAFDLIKGTILEDCRNAGRLDGVLLSLHGAMETAEDEDGEGNLLSAIREELGQEIPIVTTLDLHANLTQRMVDNATAFFPYREYPHSDMYMRGLEAANAMMRILKDGMKPVMKWKHLPLLTSLIATSSKQYAPIESVIEKNNAMSGVLNATLLHGFFMADTRDTMASVLVVTEGNADLAQDVVDTIVDIAWENRSVLAHIDAYEPEDAIAKAQQTEGLAVLADICDNPGAGSSSDGTHLLRKLLEKKVNKVAYAAICDPETVERCHKAGVGKTIPVQLGGKVNKEILGDPICRNAYVKSLSDGVYFNRGPMHGGMKVDLRKSAIIVIDGISIIVSSIPTQAYDIEIFQSHGLMLNDFDILVVKSSVHYRAAFGPYSQKLLPVKCPGVVELDPTKLPYKRKVTAKYPIDFVE